MADGERTRGGRLGRILSPANEHGRPLDQEKADDSRRTNIMKPMPKAERLASLVSSVTETMLSISFAAVTEAQAHPSLNWRTAIMLVNGPRPVSVGLSSDESGCGRLAAAMFGCEPGKVDVGMMNDALCELVNMTAGLLKREMSLDQALTVPVIVDDKTSLDQIAQQHPALVLKAREVGIALWACEGLLKWTGKAA
jgi:Chemotaxis phosphatase CheX